MHRLLTPIIAIALAFAAAPAALASHAGPLTASCTNPEVGYSVNFPNNWFYNLRVTGSNPGVEDIERCRYFSPEDFDLTPGSEPSGVAIGFNVQNQPFDPSEGESVTVGGRDAYRVEVGDPGSRAYIYGIDIGDGQTLVAQTSETWVGPYDENKTILDEMMDSLEFIADVDRIAGDDRYGTAAAISEAAYAPGVSVAYVATGVDFPDALAVAPAAALNDGPVLLTLTDTLPAVTANELDRLDPGRIVVLGGPEAVSEAVEDELSAYSDTVVRIAGDNRYATAAEIAQATFPGGSNVAYVARGDLFPDALAGGALAGSRDAPILLVRPNGIPAETAEELDRLGLSRIVILGGPAAVSQSVAADLFAYADNVYRIGGANRYETAANIAEAAYPDGARLAYVATGLDFPDALAVSPVAANNDAPVLLVAGDSVPAATANELERLGLDRIVVAGGPDAVAPAVVDALATYAR